MAFGLSLFLTLRVNFHENLKQYIQLRLVPPWEIIPTTAICYADPGEGKLLQGRGGWALIYDGGTA